MPWADSAGGIVHTRYLGNATGETIADMLLGKVNPSAKLSLTFPEHMEDPPSHGHFHSENGKVRILQFPLVYLDPKCWFVLWWQGYKHYHHRKIVPLFPFGYILYTYSIAWDVCHNYSHRHGLSHTTFNYSNLELSRPSSPAPTYILLQPINQLL